MTFLRIVFFAALIGAASLVDAFTAQPSLLLSRPNSGAVAEAQDQSPRLDGDEFALKIYSSYGYGAGETFALESYHSVPLFSCHEFASQHSPACCCALKLRQDGIMTTEVCNTVLWERRETILYTHGKTHVSFRCSLSPTRTAIGRWVEIRDRSVQTAIQ